MTGNARVRHIAFEGCQNFRDLGGYRTADGRSVRWGMLYRSGDLTLLTNDDVGIARGLNISTVINFRSDPAASLDAGPLAREVRVYHHLPIDPGQVDRDSGFANWTERFLVYLDHAVVQARLKAAIEALAADSGLPAVFHCARGKDRTGLVAAVLLGSFGVVDADIAADYALSSEHYDATKFRALFSAVAARGGPSLEATQAATRRFTMPGYDESSPETMFELMARVREEHGSMRGYVRSIGVDEECLSRLEQTLLVREAAG